eukprot:2929328-Prymnesium_polylepis.1
MPQLRHERSVDLDDLPHVLEQPQQLVPRRRFQRAVGGALDACNRRRRPALSAEIQAILEGTLSRIWDIFGTSLS